MQLENRPEAKSFLRTALAWRGSVTPVVLPRVFMTIVYATFIYLLVSMFPQLSLPITPFEYSGAVLGLLLVLRVNAGVDRWWEARKIWGSIVNQSRNLAINVAGYAVGKSAVGREAIKWVAIWPHVMRASLRGQRKIPEVEKVLGPEVEHEICVAQHMPTYVGFKLTRFLQEMKREGLDPLAFHRADAEKALLIDAIGASERIRNTRMPLVLAIKTRRFILLFLMLLPFAMADRLGWLMPLVVGLVAYPMFSLDEIGAELQNPFSDKNLSHLPLNGICETIEGNVLALLEQAPQTEADRDDSDAAYLNLPPVRYLVDKAEQRI